MGCLIAYLLVETIRAHVQGLSVNRMHARILLTVYPLLGLLTTEHVDRKVIAWGLRGIYPLAFVFHAKFSKWPRKLKWDEFHNRLFWMPKISKGHSGYRCHGEQYITQTLYQRGISSTTTQVFGPLSGSYPQLIAQMRLTARFPKL